MKQDLINKIYAQGDLAFFWEAYKKDGIIFPQFEITEEDKLTENLFTDIDKYPENYKKFELVSINNSKVKFSVDLETGDFTLNGVLIKNNIRVDDQQLRCTFWRRKAITLNLANSQESSKYLYYILGWHTNIEGASIKKEYMIFPDFSLQEIFYKQSKKVYSRGRIIKN